MVSLPTELYKIIMIEADIDTIQKFCMIKHMNLYCDFNFWCEKFKHDHLLFMNQCPMNTIAWVKEYKKIYYCQALSYMLSQIGNVYIFLPYNTPQTVFENLRTIGCVIASDTVDMNHYNFSIAYNIASEKVNVTISTLFRTVHLTDDLPAYGILIMIIRILYYYPHINLCNKDGMSYIKNNIYLNTLIDLKEHPKILYDFMTLIHTERQGYMDQQI